jgi:hypothetical protein
MLDVDDQCPTNAGTPAFYGCPAADDINVTLQVVDQTKSGYCPGNKPSCKMPLVGAEVRVFDRSALPFKNKHRNFEPDNRDHDEKPNKTNYNDVFDGGVGMIGSCTTGASGSCRIGEKAPGKYLVIVKYFDQQSGQVAYAGKNKNPDDFKTTTNGKLATKNLKFMKTIKKDRAGRVSYQCDAGEESEYEGSYLRVTYPDTALWRDDVEEYTYPFVFSTDSSWDVDVCTKVPEGYEIAGVMNEDGQIVSNNSCAHTLVAGEDKVLLFRVVDVGSPSLFSVSSVFTLKDNVHPKTVTDTLENQTERVALAEVLRPRATPLALASEGKTPVERAPKSGFVALKAAAADKGAWIGIVLGVVLISGGYVLAKRRSKN